MLPALRACVLRDKTFQCGTVPHNAGRLVTLIRRPNYQNDRIWAKSIEDIEADERYQELLETQLASGFL